jgi:hypothetical protein
LYKLRCDRETNGIELKRNSKFTGVGFTNNIVKKKFEFQITHTHKTKYATERDGKEAKEGTLSPCRKTAAALRDGDTRHEQNGGSVPVGAI